MAPNCKRGIQNNYLSMSMEKRFKKMEAQGREDVQERRRMEKSVKGRGVRGKEKKTGRKGEEEGEEKGGRKRGW